MPLSPKPLNNVRQYPLLMAFVGTLSVISLFVLSGCASKGDNFYMHQPTTQPLEVPPDLTLPEANSGFEVPEIASVERKKIFLNNGATVVLKKDGRLRWLEISASPDAVWENVKDFWITKKVPLEWQNLKLGLLETDWIKSYDNDYAKDRFRIRIEPGKEPNTSELYLSHRERQETMVAGEVLYGWGEERSDPELEVEVLGELLSYLGLNAERKVALLDNAKEKADTAVFNDKVPSISMKESTVRGWRFVMQAVDRMGNTVVERDKKQGWLDVRIESDVTADFTPGFSLSDSDRDMYRVQLTTVDAITTVTVLNDQGQTDHSEQAKLFLESLHKNM